MKLPLLRSLDLCVHLNDLLQVSLRLPGHLSPSIRRRVVAFISVAHVDVLFIRLNEVARKRFNLVLVLREDGGGDRSSARVCPVFI